MQLKEAAGQIIIAGYEGTSPTIPLEGAIKTGKIGGVIFFRRNFIDLPQIFETNKHLAQLAPAEMPLFLSIDQEGGKVQRIKEDLGATKLPRAMACREKEPQLVYELGGIMARELQSLGFNLNFAPVVDIHTNPANPIIGERAYGLSAQEVSAQAVEIIRAHNDCGMLSCAKHFPGHGDTDTDSHTALPIVQHGIELLRERELVPFAAAISAGVPMIMTAHILMPALGSRHPATLSSNVIKDLLRKEMGFEGVIVSDDLEMDAIADNYSALRAMILGLLAGVDVFIVSKRQVLWHSLRDQLVEAAQDDKALQSAIHRAAERTLECKRRMSPLKDEDWQKIVGCQEHLDFIAQNFD